MDEELIREAKNYLKTVDHIVDLYDLLIVWVSPKWIELSGYTADELISVNILKLLDDSYSDHDKRKLVIDRITKRNGFDTVHVKAKNGSSIHAKTEYNVINYKGGIYLTGRICEIVTPAAS